MWGQPLPVWIHGNISLAAVVAVFVHIAPRMFKLGPGLAWIATALFVLSALSGLYGLYIATTPASRKRWLRRHRPLTYAFYLCIIPHVTGQLLGWPIAGAIAMGWAAWHWKGRIRARLGQTDWPFSRANTPHLLRTLHPGWAALLKATTSWPALTGLLLVLGASVTVSLAQSVDRHERKAEVKGQIEEIFNGSFILRLNGRSVQVITPDRTKIEGRDADLASWQQTGATVKVEEERRSDGAILAKEIERK